MFGIGKVGWPLFIIFLIAYFLEKYLVAAPPVFLWDYLRDVLVITAMTAIVPFLFIAWLVRRAASPLPHAVLALIGCVLLSALGYAAYWYFTVSQFPGAPPVEMLAMRGIRPGIIMAAILVFDRWWGRRPAIRG